MDIILTDTALRRFLKSSVDNQNLSEKISLCGPTFDRVKKVEGDTLYEIEIITNRIDVASALGVAREAAAILPQFDISATLVNDPYLARPVFPGNLPKHFHFELDPGLAVRFTAISLERVTIKPSPASVQKFLNNSGQRPLNNCIDITNELTLLYGLPSHIFDLDKLAAQHLRVRESRPGEKIITLDNKENLLTGGDIVIEDGSGRLVDLCGVMGGQVAEVDEHTKNILLIVPVYTPSKIRHTSLSVQKRTLAAQIYEKGPDPELCLAVTEIALQLFKERAGAIISSSLYDYYPKPWISKNISLDFNWLNTLVGVELSSKKIADILHALGFKTSPIKNGLLCTIPSWRHQDINLQEDLLEEVARVYGYFRLPAVLPCVNLLPELNNRLLQTEIKAKKYLSAIGFHEIYNSSLVSANLLNQTEQDPKANLKLKNALSADFEYLRTALVPSLLENQKHNQGKIDGPVDIYELANCYLPEPKKELPREVSHLGLVSTGTFLETKGKLEALFNHLHLQKLSFKPAATSPAYFDTASTVEVLLAGQKVGLLGLINPLTLRNLGLHQALTAVDLNLVDLVTFLTPATYRPLSEYPSVLEDITLSSDKLLGEVIRIIENSSKLITGVRYLQSYQNKHSFRVTFTDPTKNLDQSRVNALKEIIQERFRV